MHFAMLFHKVWGFNSIQKHFSLSLEKLEISTMRSVGNVLHSTASVFRFLLPDMVHFDCKKCGHRPDERKSTTSPSNAQVSSNMGVSYD